MGIIPYIPRRSMFFFHCSHVTSSRFRARSRMLSTRGFLARENREGLEEKNGEHIPPCHGNPRFLHS